MKFTTTFSVLLSSLLTSASAHSPSVKGASYFITNQPSGNHVVAANILSDGTLSFGKAVPAQGSGVHGLPSPAGADPLFSQGSIQVAQGGNFLATVNSGSNTVSMFSINPKDPADIKMVGFPVSSGGEFPISVSITSAGDAVCVLNGGIVAGVNCFSVDHELGLTSLNQTIRPVALNQTTPATGPAGTASQIAFSADGSQLFVSVKGTPPTPGYIAIWNVSGHATSFALSSTFKSMAPPSGGVLPFSITLIPNTNSALVTDPGIGYDIFDFSGKTAGSAVAIANQSAVCWSSYSPKTGNYYLSDAGTGLISEIRVSSALVGGLVEQYPQGNNTIDSSIATVGDDDYLYVLTPLIAEVQVLSLAAAGKAKHIQSFKYLHDVETSCGSSVAVSNFQGMATYMMKN